MPSKEKIWWSSTPPNKPVSPEIFERIFKKVQQYLKGKEDLYVFDGYCGSSKKSSKKIRFVTEYAWHHHFVTNVFVRPKVEELKDFTPDFTVLNCSKGLTNEEWKEMGLNSESFIGFNLEKKIGIILGSQYGGEMKKGIFSLMNYWLPNNGILTMHSSVYKGKDGKTALFFGLSGTGKTSLSADPERCLIGDDEHGWDDDGLFNLEGGCYAKTINLSRQKEPMIYNAIKERALLENVWINHDFSVDYNNTFKTTNGRVSYPLYHIDNYVKRSKGKHPSAIIFLTCDSSGILPPVSILTPQQAIYHFLSGYTAKGINEPTPSFSPGFGGDFMLLHPTVYAKLLREKLEQHHIPSYLVNTGWSGGPYGIGKRMDIDITRKCIDTIVKGMILTSEYKNFDVFNMKTPTDVPGVSSHILDSRETWKDKKEYDKRRIELAKKFIDNYNKYKSPNFEDYSKFGPQIN